MNRIDVHHHFFPVPYLARERERVLAAMDLNPSQLLDWTPALALEELDRHGIATALTSISTPGIWFGDAEAARTLARECNEYAAQMARDYPGRFGNFAAIPLPDVEGSLREIEYALDTLGADGIGLLSSYEDKWPGDVAFAPVFDELERRRAVVYVHPTAPACCRKLIPGIPPALTEFYFDTTRAITSLLFSGTFARCPNVRFIFSHGGGAMTVLSSRMDFFGRRHTELADRYPSGVMHELKRQYYDIANSTNAPAFSAMSALIPLSQLLFGTDFPYIPIGATIGGMPNLGLDAESWKKIDRENALRLFPRLAAVLQS
ncbi:MAG TPA: amidohydrolase family protein [Candidatus Binatia bacterium]|nr:amidohydrolase family protein [Candidatus Binatia bacterium]